VSPFLHEVSDVDVLIERASRDMGIIPQLIEKDYWIMHCLYGLSAQGFEYELKGGTSLSKGYGIIDRFSEDLDIKILPPPHLDVKIGKNQDSPKQIASRVAFYDWLAKEISIPGISCKRDLSFDDKKGRNGGIQLAYESLYPVLGGIKPYVLLEVGFDNTAPNEKLLISSWLFDEGKSLNLDVVDNRAVDIICYHPGYTFVEKLAAISGKFRKEQERKIMPVNFIRHFYDIYKLLDEPRVLEFIGTDAYLEHKKSRFSTNDELNLSKNEAFILSHPTTRERYANEYRRTKALYYRDFPSFDEIFARIQSFIERI
jgi:hypothetical protein